MLASRVLLRAAAAARVPRRSPLPPVSATVPQQPRRRPTADALTVAALPPHDAGGADAAALTPPLQPAATGQPPVLARAWAAYDAALAKHPIAVKAATSFVGFLLGDLIAQSIVGLPYDAHRTLRLVLFGVCMDGPVGELEGWDG